MNEMISKFVLIGDILMPELTVLVVHHSLKIKNE